MACRRVNQLGQLASELLALMPESGSEVGVWERLPKGVQICPISQSCVFFSGLPCDSKVTATPLVCILLAARPMEERCLGNSAPGIP